MILANIMELWNTAWPAGLIMLGLAAVFAIVLLIASIKLKVEVDPKVEQVHNALGQLSRREREVLEMRFGLKDGQAHTLEEVGQAFGVTRERIRQIEAKALRKLRHPIRSRKLRDYLSE